MKLRDSPAFRIGVSIAVACALVTVMTVPVAPPGVPILVAAVVAGAWGWLRPEPGGATSGAPARWLSSASMTRVAATLTIGLLASLTVMNAFGSGRALAVDARAASLLAAAVG